MSLVTFKQDVHIVDYDEGIDQYFNFNDTVDVSDQELELVDKYAKKWKLNGDVYVKGSKELVDEDSIIAPRVDSPSHPDNADNGTGAPVADK